MPIILMKVFTQHFPKTSHHTILTQKEQVVSESKFTQVLYLNPVLNLTKVISVL